MSCSEKCICTIYKSDKEKELYLYVEKDSDLKETIPEELLVRMGVMSEVLTILITVDRKLARAEASKVLHDIADKGFYLQLPPAELIVGNS